MKTTAENIKALLMRYWRIDRGYLCSCEVSSLGVADVLADNGKEAVEIEVKVDKYDLLNDAKKSKHEWFNKDGPEHLYYKGPNRFYFCVTANLREPAERLIGEINPLYGLILYRDGHLEIEIRARKLHNNYDGKIYKAIANSLCFFRTKRMIKEFNVRNQTEIRV